MTGLGNDYKAWVYFILLFIGGACMTFLLATLLWRSINRKLRNPLLLSLCFCWWISTFPILPLLFYAGMVKGPDPPFRLCFASAVLVLSQPLLAALTPVGLVLHMWLQIRRTARRRYSTMSNTSGVTLALVVIPYIAFIAGAIAVSIIGAKNPSKVHRAHFYCVVDDMILTMTVSVIGAISLLATIIFAIWTLVLLRKNHAALVRRGLDVGATMRICVFGAYTFLGLCLNLIAIVDFTSVIPDLFFATCGIAVFLIFGTSGEIRNTWKPGHVSRGTVSAHPSQSRTLSTGAIDMNASLSPKDKTAGSQDFPMTSWNGTGGKEGVWSGYTHASESTDIDMDKPPAGPSASTVHITLPESARPVNLRHQRSTSTLWH